MTVVPTPDQVPTLISADGMHQYVERHYGKRAGQAVGGLLVLTFCAVCAAVLFTVVRGGYRIVVETVGSRSIPSVDATSVVVTALAFAAIFGVGWRLSKRITSVNKQLGQVNNELKHVIDYLNDNVHTRLMNLESDRKEQQAQIVKLEQHTDIHGKKQALIDQMSKQLEEAEKGSLPPPLKGLRNIKP